MRNQTEQRVEKGPCGDPSFAAQGLSRNGLVASSDSASKDSERLVSCDAAAAAAAAAASVGEMKQSLFAAPASSDCEVAGAMGWSGLAVGELPDEYRSLYRHCKLCPRKCGVDRTRGEVGVCGASDALKLGRAALHWWEEPCLVGDQGSGAVFFSWCPMHCVYCQNHDLAWGDGIEVSDAQLEQVVLRLQNEEHAANINLVTPTHYVPHIAWTLRKMKTEGTLKVPVVYNCSGYESVEALRLLDGLVDIYLVDFKYANPMTAKKLSKCADYPQVALAAIKEMVRQVGVWREDPQTGLLKKGVIVRHLVLPNHVQDSADAVCMLNDALGESLRPHGPFLPVVRLSVMNQFVATDATGNLARYDLVGAVSPEEYDAVLDIADALGIEDYFWQEGGANAESFIPKFDGTGVV